MAMAATGMVWLTGLGPHSTYAAHVLPPLLPLVLGFGLGLVTAPRTAPGTAPKAVPSAKTAPPGREPQPHPPDVPHLDRSVMYGVPHPAALPERLPHLGADDLPDVGEPARVALHALQQLKHLEPGLVVRQSGQHLTSQPLHHHTMHGAPHSLIGSGRP